jgi:hypothetical protein
MSLADAVLALGANPGQPVFVNGVSKNISELVNVDTVNDVYFTILYDTDNKPVHPVVVVLAADSSYEDVSFYGMAIYIVRGQVVDYQWSSDETDDDYHYTLKWLDDNAHRLLTHEPEFMHALLIMIGLRYANL